MRKILVYGSGDFGKIIRNLLRLNEFEFVGFIDDIHPISDEASILGNFEHIKETYSPNIYEIALGIGYKDLKARWNIFKQVKSNGYQLTTIIHPTAYVDPSSKIGEGTIIMANSTIDYNVQLGNGVVVWPGVVINHDCVINNNIFFSPNSTVCGFGKVGSNCFIGAGSVIVDHREVPSNSFIKAATLY